MLYIKKQGQLIDQKEERYKSLFDGNFSVMLLIDPETGEIKDSNTAASNYYGWSHDELCSKNISEINQLTEVEIKAEMIKAVEENRNMFFFKHKLFSGEIRDVEVYSGPIKFPDKTLLYSIVHDVVDRKKTEAELLESETNYRFMFDHNPQPMWIIDLETLDFIEVNNSATNLYGFSKEEFLKMNLRDLRIENQIPELLNDIEQSKKISQESNWVVERIHKKKNGEFIYVQITAHNIMFNGKIASHALINDITKRKRAEKLVEQTKANYQGFFNTINEFVFVLDMNGNIIHANPAVYKRLGYTTEELVGKPVTIVHPVHLKGEAMQIVGDMLCGKTEMCTIPIITKSGEYIPVETRVTEGVWNGEPVIFGFTKDISKIQLSEEKFSKVFHLNPSPAILNDLNDKTQCDFNDAFFKIYGFEKEDVINKSPYSLGILSPEMIELVKSKTNAEGTLDNVEVEIRTKNGEIKYAMISSEIIKFQGQQIRYDVLHDITEIKKAESTIKDKVNLLTNLIINLGEGVLLENSKREIVLTNELFCNMFGIPAPPEALIGMDCSQSAEQSKSLFKNPDTFVKNIISILAEKKMVLDEELELIDGRFFERDYIPTFLNNEYNGHLWKYRDITERKKNEIELKETQEQLKKYAAHLQNVREEERILLAREIHDDLGQKIVALKIDAWMLKKSLIAEQNNELTKATEENFDKLFNLLDNTNKTTRRILSGLRPETIESMGFIEAIRTYLSDFKERYKIDYQFNNSISNIYVNSQQSIALYRILQESLNNIAKHAQASKIEISLFAMDSKLQLIISDDGIGFDVNKKKKNDSFGLIGMKERVFLLEGELQIESKKNAGTKILVSLKQN